MLVAESSCNHEATNQCCFNAGPTSTTLGQHWNNTGSASGICWRVLTQSAGDAAVAPVGPAWHHTVHRADHFTRLLLSHRHIRRRWGHLVNKTHTTHIKMNHPRSDLKSARVSCQKAVNCYLKSKQFNLFSFADTSATSTMTTRLPGTWKQWHLLTWKLSVTAVCLSYVEDKAHSLHECHVLHQSVNRNSHSIELTLFVIIS